MKKQVEIIKYHLMLAFFLLFNATIVLGQGGGAENTGEGAGVTVSKSTTTTSTTVQEWYAQSWVWIVGGLVFILLLVALVRGGGSRTDVHRTTIHRDMRTD